MLEQFCQYPCNRFLLSSLKSITMGSTFYFCSFLLHFEKQLLACSSSDDPSQIPKSNYLIPPYLWALHLTWVQPPNPNPFRCHHLKCKCMTTCSLNSYRYAWAKCAGRPTFRWKSSRIYWLLKFHPDLTKKAHDGWQQIIRKWSKFCLFIQVQLSITTLFITEIHHQAKSLHLTK